MSKPRQNERSSSSSKNIQIPDNILRQLLTSSEIRMLTNRYQIMNFLQEGLSIRSVASKVGVGTDTVVRVSRIIERSKSEIFKKSKKIPFKTSTPWIFGKSD